MTKEDMSALTVKTAESLSKAKQDFAEGKTKPKNLPDGWTHMPSIPVLDGSPETLKDRQDTARQDFLEGVLRDSDGKLITDYSEKEQAAKRGWLSR